MQSFGFQSGREALSSLEQGCSAVSQMIFSGGTSCLRSHLGLGRAEVAACARAGGPDAKQFAVIPTDGTKLVEDFDFMVAPGWLVDAMKILSFG